MDNCNILEKMCLQYMYAHLIINKFSFQIIIVPPQKAFLTVRNFNLIKHNFYVTHKTHFFSSEPHQYAN